jgi:HlyD family secretion protein
VGKKVRLDAEVDIELANVKSQEYGALIGNIAYISQYPVSPENLTTAIHNPDLIQYFSQNKAAIVGIIVEPQRDPNTPSGYRWTSGQGPSIQLTSGTLCTFRGLVEEIPPYLYFIPVWWIKKMIYHPSNSSLEENKA